MSIAGLIGRFEIFFTLSLRKVAGYFGQVKAKGSPYSGRVQEAQHPPADRSDTAPLPSAYRYPAPDYGSVLSTDPAPVENY